ncbi:MAG: hypothetical protein AB7S99_09715 [Pseudodonghicola sp.]
MILSLALLGGCTQVNGVADTMSDTVRGGLEDFSTLATLGLLNKDKAAAAPAPEVEAAPESAPEALPQTPAVPAVKPAGDGRLGRTVAGLGDPGKPGLWLETPLVTAAGKGRVVWPSTGRWVAVALLPSGGAVTAGSRMSLDAFRALGAPLTDLIEVEVYAGG